MTRKGTTNDYSVDSDAADMEDTSSQDDTCSERSGSTTTSNQRDSKHCDCCYCEVFGHGINSSTTVSRNYQEMRERLRLLLSKKKEKKCKGDSQNETDSQDTSSNSKLGTEEAVIERSHTQENDPRDLEKLLEYIEGNQPDKCKNSKKAARKQRQKQRKAEEKIRREEEELELQEQQQQEQQRLNELQAKTPEVTITLVKTPGGKTAQGPVGQKTQAGKNQSSNSESAKSGSPDSPPQMVTIKRVMEPNSAEPTVTITLKGETPEKDKVLFTLVNGQDTDKANAFKDRLQETSQLHQVEDRVSGGNAARDEETGSSRKKQKKKTKKNGNNGSVVENSDHRNSLPQKSSSVNQNQKEASAKVQSQNNLKESSGSKLLENGTSKQSQGRGDSGVQPVVGQQLSKPKENGKKQGKGKETVPSKQNGKTESRGKSDNSANGKQESRVPETIPTKSQPSGLARQSEVIIRQVPHPPIQRAGLRKIVMSPSIVDSVQQASANGNKKKKKSKKKNGQNSFEELDSVFAPKDIDLENGDIDDAERELEAFKRFCFNSVPLQHKEKVNLNVKDIFLKKKPLVGYN